MHHTNCSASNEQLHLLDCAFSETGASFDMAYDQIIDIIDSYLDEE